MKIGICFGSYSPFHKVHLQIIEKASHENEIVMVMISLNDRKRLNEFPICSKEKALLWKEHYQHIMPSNVKLHYTFDSPIKKVFEIINKLKEQNLKDEITIYGGDNLHEIFSGIEDVVKLAHIQRDGTSGTLMREFLQKQNKKEFIKLLPDNVNGESIYEILLSGNKSIE